MRQGSLELLMTLRLGIVIAGGLSLAKMLRCRYWLIKFTGNSAQGKCFYCGVSHQVAKARFYVVGTFEVWRLN